MLCPKCEKQEIRGKATHCGKCLFYMSRTPSIDLLEEARDSFERSGNRKGNRGKRIIRKPIGPE